MKEIEYIKTVDVARIRVAKESLFYITPETNPLIDGDEYIQVIRLLRKWDVDITESYDLDAE